MTPPNFSARSTTSPVRLLQRALVILVLKQTLQFRSFGKGDALDSGQFDLGQRIYSRQAHSTLANST